jgi:hypothetical protein
MCELSNTGGSDSEGKTSWEDGDLREAFTGKDFYQTLIGQAGSIGLTRVIKLYNIKLPSGVTKITCPFKNHKGGRERSPSFQLFLHTNSFYCYGCQSHGNSVDFVSKMDGTSKVTAAQKILSLFESNFDEASFLDVQDLDGRMDLMVKFSNVVRNFRQTHFDEKSEAYIEAVCAAYDRLYAKHKLYNDNESLESAINKFIYVIDSYTPCYKL